MQSSQKRQCRRSPRSALCIDTWQIISHFIEEYNDFHSCTLTSKELCHLSHVRLTAWKAFKFSAALELFLAQPQAALDRKPLFSRIPRKEQKLFTIPLLISLPWAPITPEMRHRDMCHLLTQNESVRPEEVQNPVTLLMDVHGWAIVLRVCVEQRNSLGELIGEQKKCCIWAHSYRGSHCMVKYNSNFFYPYYFDTEQKINVETLLTLIHNKVFIITGTTDPDDEFGLVTIIIRLE